MRRRSFVQPQLHLISGYLAIVVTGHERFVGVVPLRGAVEVVTTRLGDEVQLNTRGLNVGAV